MIDLIAHNFSGNRSPSIKCLDHGFVRLVDSMPRVSYVEADTTADSAIVQAARVSYGDGTKQISEDRGLIRYLMRHQHTTPLEMVEFKFHCSMPIFVARQWIRHRTANVNEYSARYSVVKDLFYDPGIDNVRAQSKSNKQASEGQIDAGDAQWFLDHLNNTSSQTYQVYEEAMKKGVGREQARMILPLNCYTEWYWKIDLHNLLRFLSLRCDKHAQKEIQDFANAMLSLVKPIVPITIEAWEDYDRLRGAILLTRLEVEAIKNRTYKEVGEPNAVGEYQEIPVMELNTDNKREQEEWNSKKKLLGF